MEIEPYSTDALEIKVGVTTAIRMNQSFRFVIETRGGTVIEGTVTANNPLEITPSTDIKKIDLIIDKDHTRNLLLVD